MLTVTEIYGLGAAAILIACAVVTGLLYLVVRLVDRDAS